MAEMHDGKYRVPGQDDEDDLEHLLLQGVTLQQETRPDDPPRILSPEEDDDEEEVSSSSDVQGALGLYAEAAQDMATASVELGLGRHFACADFCNQATEKAAQSVSLLRFGRRSTYNHDLRALGALIGAPVEIQDEMDILSPFHPEAFYADTPPEEADAVINAEQASSYIQSARKVMRWAKTIVLA
ncbi:MAG: HEPN domain-containing protein [Ktedonobacteraceae bacterium]|nr:HEPN domain-containing protein [Ktedonobacteraceae bacterium]